MQKLLSLAQGVPTYDAWQAVTRILDDLDADAQARAVEVFEAASAHWPTKLNPWTGFDLTPGLELRRSPEHWVKEVYSGQHAPKHALLRILESPQRPMGAQKLEHLLAPAAQLPRVCQVGFNQLKVSGGFLKSLKGEGLWRRWTALRLWTCDLKAPALKLLGAADLPSLTQLNLEQNRLGEAGLQGLVKAPAFSALTQLHLGSNDLDAAAAQLLGRMDWTHRLTWLCLSYNRLNDPGLVQLVGSGGLGALRTLDLSHNQVGRDTALWAQGLVGLEVLKLNDTATTDAGLGALLAHTPALHTLNLDDTSVGDDGVRALATSPQRWRALCLQGTKVTAAGLGALLRAPSAESLERLVVGPGLDLDNAHLLVDGACPRLRHLTWNDRQLGPGVEKLLRADARITATLPH